MPHHTIPLPLSAHPQPHPQEERKSSRLFTRVKHALLRTSPRADKFSDAGSEGDPRDREVIDVRRLEKDKYDRGVEAAYEVSLTRLLLARSIYRSKQPTARASPEPSTPTSVLPRIHIHPFSAPHPHSPHHLTSPLPLLEEDDAPSSYPSSTGGAASDCETSTYRPSIRKRGSDTIRVSRPTTATSRRHEPTYAEASVQCSPTEMGSSGGQESFPLAAMARIRTLEQELSELQAAHAVSTHESDDLRLSLSNAQREVEALHLEHLISEKFIETIKVENRELLMDLAHLSGADAASVSHLGLGSRGWEEEGSDMVPTRPTSVASSFDAQSWLSSGAWSAPPLSGGGRSQRAASRDSAPIVLGAERKTPEAGNLSLPLPITFPPGAAHGQTSPTTPNGNGFPNGSMLGTPPGTGISVSVGIGAAPSALHNHHRRPTATSISSSCSSAYDSSSPPSHLSVTLPHAHPYPPIPPPPPPPPAHVPIQVQGKRERERKLGPQRRDSISSLRRTSHSHTPTQPSPLALDVLSHEDTEGDVEADGSEEGIGGAVDTGLMGTVRRESCEESPVKNRSPSVYYGAELSRTSTVASSVVSASVMSGTDGEETAEAAGRV
ncbi:hypothetical protein DACRYDRAFT_118402 [Dacryopinax primogenitus]|uniref:Uncharacterized protein n=1 Tax=Dacryopinax primogenitus (strain DJM 731) TaxID=1858805 RepID=M5G5W2_DACPD|nr:uncharacterized protein DACRYDRAFT_118402 [Dacryopinax primogenitus]EJT99147.1 hypothetical protein DACRYDRAFT_118402 [Dacryopinax primogenitus]